MKNKNNLNTGEAIMEARCALLDVVQLELRPLRLNLGYTSYEVAKMVGVSRMRYICWEAGKAPLTCEAYPALASALDDLIRREGVTELARQLVDGRGRAMGDPAYTTAFVNGSLLHRWHELYVAELELNDGEDTAFEAEHVDKAVSLDTDTVEETDGWADYDTVCEDAEEINDLLYGRRIIVDESALCAEGVEACIDLLDDAFLSEDNRLIIPLSALEKLEQRAAAGSEEAQRALTLAKNLHEEGQADIYSTHDAVQGEDSLLNFLSQSRMKHHMCLLTQNTELARKALALNSELFSGSVTVGCIEENGKPAMLHPEDRSADSAAAADEQDESEQ